MELDEVLGAAARTAGSWYASFRKDVDLTGIAKSLGKTSAELHQAYKEGAAGAQASEKSGDEFLLGIAQRLGIDTQGKSLTQIAEEIVKRSS